MQRGFREGVGLLKKISFEAHKKPKKGGRQGKGTCSPCTSESPAQSWMLKAQSSSGGTR